MLGELLDVVDQAEESPLRFDLGASAEREAIEPFVVTQIRKHRLDRAEALPVGGASVGRIDLLFHPGRQGANSKIGLARWHRGDTTATPLGMDSTFAGSFPALSPDGRWLAFASNASGSGRSEVFVRPYPDVKAGRWQVSQAGGSVPHWSHSGRELFYINGARALVAATVVPGPSFTLGAQTKLFDASPLRTWGNITLFYDVAPDDQRFLMLRPVIEASRVSGTRPDKLVQITNWTAEVQAKLTGKAAK